MTRQALSVVVCRHQQLHVLKDTRPSVHGGIPIEVITGTGILTRVSRKADSGMTTKAVAL